MYFDQANSHKEPVATGVVNQDEMEEVCELFAHLRAGSEDRIFISP